MISVEDIIQGKEYYYAFMVLSNDPHPALYKVKAISIVAKYEKRYYKIKILKKYFDYYHKITNKVDDIMQIFVGDLYSSTKEVFDWWNKNGLTKNKLIKRIFDDY